MYTARHTVHALYWQWPQHGDSVVRVMKQDLDVACRLLHRVGARWLRILKRAANPEENRKELRFQQACDTIMWARFTAFVHRVHTANSNDS